MKAQDLIYIRPGGINGLPNGIEIYFSSRN